MAKRFISTELFDDPWFMNLSKDAKLLWVYLFTKCDHAGIIQNNPKLWKFQTDIENIDTVREELGSRLITVNEQYYFNPKFLKFQYPNFPKSKVKAQISALDILNKFKINPNTYLTLNKPLSNSYEYEYENENENENENEKIIKKSEISKTEQIEKDEILNKSNYQSELDLLCEHFDVTEMNKPTIYFELEHFINCLFINERLKYFKNQFEYYKKFKNDSNQHVHGYKNFIGDSEKLYDDGAWNHETWEIKHSEYLKKSKKQNPGDSKVYNFNEPYHD
jgi:hypothetical protein